jgi:hypothetical protein
MLLLNYPPMQSCKYTDRVSLTNIEGQKWSQLRQMTDREVDLQSGVLFVISLRSFSV